MLQLATQRQIGNLSEIKCEPLNSLAAQVKARAIYLNASGQYVPKKREGPGPALTWGRKKALVSEAIQTENLLDILPGTVRENGSVYIGRDHIGLQAIVILLGKGINGEPIAPATVGGKSPS